MKQLSSSLFLLFLFISFLVRVFYFPFPGGASLFVGRLGIFSRRSSLEDEKKVKKEKHKEQLLTLFVAK